MSYQVPLKVDWNLKVRKEKNSQTFLLSFILIFSLAFLHGVKRLYGVLQSKSKQQIIAFYSQVEKTCMNIGLVLIL